MTKMARVAPAGLLAALLSGGCLEFRGVGPEDVTPERPPRTVNVTIEYTQPNGCVNPNQGACNDPVIFFGSWMRPGVEFGLEPLRGTFVYRGVALHVPVNFPPHEDQQPYQARVYDPRLGRFAAYQLKVGGELLNHIVSIGDTDEFGRVYIDENGFGHNIF